MSQKRPRHAAAAAVQTVWTLIRIEQGARDIIGQYSREDLGVQEAQRVMAKACGLKQITHVPPWQAKGAGKDLVYRRPAGPIFWFRLEPWPLDSESA